MVVGVHKTFFKGFFPYIQRFERILDHNGIKHVRLECDDPDFWPRVDAHDHRNALELSCDELAFVPCDARLRKSRDRVIWNPNRLGHFLGQETQP